MSEINDGGPAFPATVQGWNDRLSQAQGGMSLRDWFAGQALAGQVMFEGMEGCDADLIAGCAYELADEMISRRAKAVSP